MRCLGGQHLLEARCLLRGNMVKKKKKMDQGESVEDVKFPGTYSISESEQSFAFFNSAHSKWCKLDFALY